MGDNARQLADLALVLCVAIALVPVALVARRLLLTRPIGTFECSQRAGLAHWSPGVARYEMDRLDLYRLFSVRRRPHQSLPRLGMLILDRRVPTEAERDTVLPGWVVVRCATQDGERCDTVELAMSAQDYSGLATWLESAPPGQHVSNVA